MRFAGLVAFVAAAAALVAVFYIEPQVTSAMKELVAGLFTKFEDENFPLILAAAIIAVALVFLVAYPAFVIAPQSAALQRLRSFLKRYQDEQAFTENFHDISKRLGQSRLIGHAWREFRETLVEPERSDQLIQNTVRPQIFINFSCAEQRSTALRLMPHVPNYFVGVGLLLTFVGLVAALSFASGTVGGDVDANKAVEGLRNLLAAATFKFWTSIAGLLASIVLSFVFRLCALHLEGQFGLLCSVLEQRMEFVTPQRIFVDVRDTVEEQLAETKKINTEVAMSIAESVGQQFREHVPGMLATAVQPLVDAVRESSNKVREGATGGLENLVNQFATTLQGTTSQHLARMSETLQQLTHSLKAMQGSMDSSGNEFAKRMAEASERLDTAMREMAQSMRGLTESLTAQVGQAAHVFGTRLGESLERLSHQSEQMAEQLAQQSREASSSFAEEVAKAAQALSMSATDNAESSTRFAQQLRESLGESVEGVQGALDRVGISLSSLQSQIEQQGRGMTALSERSSEVARSMTSASNAINEGLEPFQRIGQNLSEISGRLERSVASMAGKIEDAVATVEIVAEQLSGVSDTLKSAWESYRTRFESVDNDLEQAFTKLQGAVENQQRNVQDFVKNLDASFDQALSGLSGGIDGIQTTIEELTEALEKMNGSGRPK